MDAGDAQLSQFDREVSNVTMRMSLHSFHSNIHVGKISFHHSFYRCQNSNLLLRLSKNTDLRKI